MDRVCVVDVMGLGVGGRKSAATLLYRALRLYLDDVVDLQPFGLDTMNIGELGNNIAGLMMQGHEAEPAWPDFIYFALSDMRRVAGAYDLFPECIERSWFELYCLLEDRRDSAYAHKDWELVSQLASLVHGCEKTPAEWAEAAAQPAIPPERVKQILSDFRKFCNNSRN